MIKLIETSLHSLPLKQFFDSFIYDSRSRALMSPSGAAEKQREVNVIQATRGNIVKNVSTVINLS